MEKMKEELDRLQKAYAFLDKKWSGNAGISFVRQFYYFVEECDSSINERKMKLEGRLEDYLDKQEKRRELEDREFLKRLEENSDKSRNIFHEEGLRILDEEERKQFRL